MREKDIHNLIEQEEAEAKQRIWARISPQLGLESTSKQPPVAKRKTWKWATLAIALVCIVTLSIVLPLTLKDSGSRYCDYDDYTTDSLGKTLQEYFSEHNKSLLYVDWYGVAEEVKTSYGYMVGNKNDIVFFEEKFIATTGEELTFAVTDNKTQVDKYKFFYENCTELAVKNATVKFSSSRGYTNATFEYKGYIYYLRLKVDDGQERLTEIIEDMLK